MTASSSACFFSVDTHIKSTFYEQLQEWHIRTIEKVIKLRSSQNNNNGNAGGPNNNGGQNNPLAGFRKTDFDVFPGFKPALEACLLQWDDYPIPGVTDRNSSSRRWLCPCVHAAQNSSTTGVKDVSGSKDAVVSSTLPKGSAPVASTSSSSNNTSVGPSSSCGPLKGCLRGRGRSVDIGPCSEWRVTPSNGKVAFGPVDSKTSNNCSTVVLNSILKKTNSRTESEHQPDDEGLKMKELPERSDEKQKKSPKFSIEPNLSMSLDSNRSSFSSEGFCETSETEALEGPDSGKACPSSSSASTHHQNVVSNDLIIEKEASAGCLKEQPTELLEGTSSLTVVQLESSSSESKVCDNQKIVPSSSSSPHNRQLKSETTTNHDKMTPQNSSQEASSSTTPKSASLGTVTKKKGNSGSQSNDPLSSDLVIKRIEDPLEILFARAEALHAHGLTREACRLAVHLAEEMLSNPPNLVVDMPNPPTRGKRGRRFNPICHQISLLASTTLSKAAFLCSVLSENLDHHHLAFRIGLFGLEMARPPASTKALEVKLANQEQDLVVLLKRIPLESKKLEVLKEKASQLRDGQLKSRGEALLPLMLASYIFESLLLNPQNRVSPGTSILGFEAAVAALGLKANVSEAEHPLLCEGTRRQRGELALMLLVFYKDDQEKLSKIMDRLLDKDVHQMYKNPTNEYSNGEQASPSSTAVSNEPSTSASVTSPQGTFAPSETSSTSDTKTLTPSVTDRNGESLSSSNSDGSLESRDQVLPAVGAEGGLSCTYPRTPSEVPLVARQERRPSDGDRSEGASSPGWDEDYKQWEARFRCTNLKTAKKHSVGMASIDSSAPETTSSDNSPTIVRRTLWMRGPGATGPPSDSGSSGESSDSFGSGSSADRIPKLPGKGPAVNSAPNGAGPSSMNVPLAVATGANLASVANRLAGVNISGGDPISGSPKGAMQSPGGQASPPAVSSNNGSPGTNQPTPNSIVSPPASSAPNAQLTPTTQTSALKAATRFKGKRIYPSIPNQPSEASAHFMFELAKTVLTKAGGNSSTAVLFTQPASNQSHRGPHRALHMCAFQIGVYALGLHNAVSPNWLSRTYSSHVSWITGQAMEIGASAICFLIETWEGHLTPSEVCELADRASQNRDPAMVRAAGRLALSCLPHAHALNPNEITRALVQCKEQSNELLEQACLAVESAAKGGGVYPEILFEVARKWYELYEESLQGSPAASRNGNGPHGNNNRNRVQASVGEFQVPAAGNNNNVVAGIGNGNNVMNIGGNNLQNEMNQNEPQNAQYNIGQNIPHPVPVSAAVSMAQPLHQISMMQAAAQAPPYGLPQATTSYPYGFYPAIPFAPQPQLAFNPGAYQIPGHHSSGGMNPYQYSTAYHYPNVTATTATALVTASAAAAAAALQPGTMRSMTIPAGAMFPGQSLIHSNVVVTQAAAIAQSRYQTMQHHAAITAQMAGMGPSGGHGQHYHHHHQMHGPSVSGAPLMSMAGHVFSHPHVNPVGLGHFHPGMIGAQHPQHVVHHQPQPLQQLNQRQLAFLLSAYRVGMLAMETLARRVHDDRPQTKYARNPSYGEDVKWLLNCAMKLGKIIVLI